MDHPDRAGTYKRMEGGYSAFFPNHLPPTPPLDIDTELLGKLSRANRELGRLDGATEILPNPDLFIAMYVRKEAVLSSQIEGTQASLIDVLEHESGDELDDETDVGEVVNYVKAMDHGLKRIKDSNVSIELIKEMHGILLAEGRGADKNPGSFRDVQNWIGPKGGIRHASFVPPPPTEVMDALEDLENYIATPTPNILLIAGIAHVQFETIHPFVDGNGRIGRLLLTLILCKHGVISRPLLYLSYYFKLRRAEYYDRLQAVRDYGHWESWMKFYLDGVIAVAEEAARTAKAIVNLRETHRQQISSKLGKRAGKALELLEKLFDRPFVTLQSVESLIGENYQYARRIVMSLEEIDILVEVTGQKRNKRFKYAPYVDLFSSPEDEED